LAVPTPRLSVLISGRTFGKGFVRIE